MVAPVFDPITAFHEKIGEPIGRWLPRASRAALMLVVGLASIVFAVAVVADVIAGLGWFDFRTRIGVVAMVGFTSLFSYVAVRDGPWPRWAPLTLVFLLTLGLAGMSSALDDDCGDEMERIVTAKEAIGWPDTPDLDDTQAIDAWLIETDRIVAANPSGYEELNRAWNRLDACDANNDRSGEDPGPY